MATVQTSKVIDYFRKTALAGDTGLTDGQLLECFVSQRDQAAAAGLVRRHGPMVWGVCRRVLSSHHDAEDAFQATFLVLVRRAASITPREMVANWLYGVAHQTALKARAQAARRKGREKQVKEMPEPEAAAKTELWPDLQSVLDQELSRLPDKYRVVIALCDLEGKSRKEAARHLDLPEGTLSSRLTTARTMLAKRLARRGLAAAGGSVAALLSQKASAAVPTLLLSSTIKAVTLVAAGDAAATGLISANVAALTEGMVKSMLLKNLKTTLALLLMLSVAVLTSAMLGWAAPKDEGGRMKDEKSKAESDSSFILSPSSFPTAVPIRPELERRQRRQKIANSLGMQFVWIPPGTFLMGSPEHEQERNSEQTGEVGERQHKVTLTRGFYMGVHPVTQGQWEALMGKNPSHFAHLADKNLPVEEVSWNDCQAFINKLKEKERETYRLPTEAEWEYACRAGTTTPFHFGETISTDQVNYHGEWVYGNGKKSFCRIKTTPVGSFPANAFGLHDMHGNVLQWCNDRLENYPQHDVVDPQGPAQGKYRVLRGGSWFDMPAHCRSASRNRYPPEHHNYFVGFRVCFFGN